MSKTDIRIKNFVPDSSWDVVFEDGTIRPLAGWVSIETYIDGEYHPELDEIVGAFMLFDRTPYLMDMYTYLVDKNNYGSFYGDIARYQRHSITVIGEKSNISGEKLHEKYYKKVGNNADQNEN